MSTWIIVVRTPDDKLIVMEDDEEVAIFDHLDAVEYTMKDHILGTQPWEALEINE